MSRGFDECYKFMGRGGHSYFDLRSSSDGKFAHPIYRNKKRIDDEGYLTDRLSEEAVAFIDRNKEREKSKLKHRMERKKRRDAARKTRPQPSGS